MGSLSPLLHLFPWPLAPLWGTAHLKPYLSACRQSSRPARTAQKPGSSGRGSGSACCSRWRRQPRDTGRQNLQLRPSRDAREVLHPKSGKCLSAHKQHRQMSGHSTSGILDSSQKDDLDPPPCTPFQCRISQNNTRLKERCQERERPEIQITRQILTPGSGVGVS